MRVFEPRLGLGLLSRLGLLVSYKPASLTETVSILQFTLLLGSGARDKVEYHAKRFGVAECPGARLRGLFATVCIHPRGSQWPRADRQVMGWFPHLRGSLLIIP